MTDASKAMTYHIQLTSRHGETAPTIRVWADALEGDDQYMGVDVDSRTVLTLKLDGKTVARFPARLVAGWWTEE